MHGVRTNARPVVTMLERQMIEALRRYFEATARASLAESEDAEHYRAEAAHARLTYENLLQAFQLGLAEDDESVEAATDRPRARTTLPDGDR